MRYNGINKRLLITAFFVFIFIMLYAGAEQIRKGGRLPEVTSVTGKQDAVLFGKFLRNLGFKPWEKGRPAVDTQDEDTLPPEPEEAALQEYIEEDNGKITEMVREDRRLFDDEEIDTMSAAQDPQNPPEESPLEEKELQENLDEDNQRITDLVGTGKDVEESEISSAVAAELSPEEAALQEYLDEDNRKITELAIPGNDVEQTDTAPAIVADLPPEEAALQELLREDDKKILETIAELPSLSE
jgi:hypothetical protein